MTNEKQTVDRVDLPAYLNNYRQVTISVCILNGIFCDDVDLKGFKLKDFQSLTDDIRAGLDEAGFKNVEIAKL